MDDLIPVERTESKVTGRKTTIHIRRLADHKLFSNLTPEMETAAQRLHDGFRAITEGLQVKTWITERVDGNAAGSVRDYIADCTVWWFRWGHEMQRYKYPIAPIVDVFIEGKSCREVDRMRRKRNGWTKDKIDVGLELYCKIRGWV